MANARVKKRIVQRITVLLAEDHAIVRQAFRKILEDEADLKVVGEAKDGVQAVALAGKLHPAVVLMDVSMPRLNGLEATRQILQADPAAKVIMLSAHGDSAYIIEAINAGAMGYLIKQESADILGQAIREVHWGKAYFSASIPKWLHKKNRKK